MSSAAAIVDAQLDAYRARDLEAFLSFYTDDIQVRAPIDVVIDGREHMRKRYDEFFRQASRVDCEVRQRFAAGQYVVDHQFASGLTSNGPYQHFNVVVYEIEGHSIRRAWFFKQK